MHNFQLLIYGFKCFYMFLYKYVCTVLSLKILVKIIQ